MLEKTVWWKWPWLLEKKKAKNELSYNLCLLLWVDKLKKKKERKKTGVSVKSFKRLHFLKFPKHKCAHSWRNTQSYIINAVLNYFHFHVSENTAQLIIDYNFFFGKSQMQQNISFSLTRICHLNHPTHYTCDVSSDRRSISVCFMETTASIIRKKLAEALSSTILLAAGPIRSIWGQPRHSNG